jgi:SanA protein
MKKSPLYFIVYFAVCFVGLAALYWAITSIYDESAFAALYRMFLYHWAHPMQYIGVVALCYALVATIWTVFMKRMRTGLTRFLEILSVILVSLVLACPLGGMLWHFHDMQAGFFPSFWQRKLLSGFSEGLLLGPLLILLSIPFNIISLIVGYFATDRVNAFLFGKKKEGLESISRFSCKMFACLAVAFGALWLYYVIITVAPEQEAFRQHLSVSMLALFLACVSLAVAFARFARARDKFVAWGIASMLAAWGGSVIAIYGASHGRVFDSSSLDKVPHSRAAVVLGCRKVLPSGFKNLYFTRRIVAAAKLYKAGKVDCLIVSGDNHIKDYDEASDMKDALVEAGVPADRIVCDYAGFRTLDSVVRAKKVFGLDSFVVVSQEDHVRRAVFTARGFGCDAYGYAAQNVNGRHSIRTRIREQFAKVAAVLDVILRRGPKFLGPREPLPE